jgi:hypothetical protein
MVFSEMREKNNNTTPIEHEEEVWEDFDDDRDDLVEVLVDLVDKDDLKWIWVM